MAVVIRLQGLPLIAGPVDIRRFFTGLTIPDGGVHIIGGKVGEAFIIFATDEDARRAISRSGGFIKDSSIELFLSSKAEMQKTIEMKRTLRVGRGRLESGASGVGNLYNFTEAMKEEESYFGYGSSINQDADFHSNGTGLDLMPRKTRPLKAENPYLFLRGLPYLVNEDDVRVFFSGLWVDGVIFLKHHDGRNNGDAIVKFASCVDASGGLKCHRSFMGSRFIEVMQGSEQQWIEFGGGATEGGDTPHRRSEEHSPSRGINDRHFRRRSHSKSPRRTRSRSPLGFYVHLKNLSLSINKRDLRYFFRDTDLSNDQIKFLYKDERRTRYAFVMFKNEKDYNIALHLHKTVLLYRPVFINPISREQMLKFIEHYEKSPGSVEKERPGHVSQKYSQEGYSDQKLCIYIRNFPFDVTKVEVQKFFADFSLVEDDIYLLFDDKGVGLGEALVRFKSEEQAKKAERLNRRRFLGTEVLLRLISEVQMQEFGVNFSLLSSEKAQDRSHLFDLNDPPGPSSGPSELVGYQPEDLRQRGHFKHPHRHFQQSDRHLPEDSRLSPEDFRHSPEDFKHLREEHIRRSREEDWRWTPEDDFRQSREKDFRQPPEEDFRRSPQEHFRRPSQEHFRRSSQEHFRRPPQEHCRYYREEDFRHVADEDFRHPSDEDFRTLQEDLRCPTDEDFRQLPVEDLRGVPEEDLRLPDSFRTPGQEFWTSPDFRGHRPFLNFGRLEGGKFDFGKHNMGSFPEGRFMPDLKVNCGSGRITPIKIMNLPFKANANEILDFFHGYKVIPDSVSIQYNEQGLPIGEAIVAMMNYNEAISAIKDLNGRPVGSRKVKLILL